VAGTGISGAYTGELSKGLKCSVTGGEAAGAGVAAESGGRGAGADGALLFHSTRASTTRLTPSNNPKAATHSGRRLRRAPDRVSINPGTVWRCRSISDFLSASRMNDMRPQMPRGALGSSSGEPGSANAVSSITRV